MSQGSQPAQGCAKAESVARERGRPVEPDPGNAGEGMQLQILPQFSGSFQTKGRIMKPTRGSIEPQSSEPLPKSSKVYIKGKLHADVRVPLREIQLTPTKSHTGKSEVNAPVRVYDCSGPWGDEEFQGNVGEGLPALRRSWILGRGDVEEVAPSYRPIPGRSDAEIPATLKRKPLRAKAGKIVTQFQYARKGIITPEMEFIAIRENFLEVFI